ncbi:MAG: tryptophan--tRNA ligase [Patescibacteria group bacterium]
MSHKKTIFSGIKPSGDLTIGNYIGAITQWVEMQEEYNCIFSVVDYHAITVKQKPEELRRRILDITKIYLASGINPNKSVIFQQSAVPAHTELAWVLNCCGTYISDLKRMIQFKEKAGDKQDAVSVGLFDYPVLMAADIILYDTQIVPVGEDQKQHVELARDIAKRFNNQYGPVFIIPEALIKKEGARIMSLSDPMKKMAKSDDNPVGFIALLDSPEVAKKKIMKAVTDSGSEIIYDEKNKPALANLLTIYSSLSGESIKSLEKKFTGKGYGDFKKELAEVVAIFLTDFQKKFNKISDADAKKILEKGCKQATKLADAKMEKVRKVVGVK